jgi:quercetin dioxygenase-like cupin family protein
MPASAPHTDETGIHVSRVADIPWEDRINVDNWPSQAGMYVDDRENAFTLRLINYPAGSTEPRHVHAGSHATTVLRGRAIVDGRTLGPLDVILGPSNEPHGPIHYPDGCRLLSAFQGSYFHSEVQQLSTEPQYRLIESASIDWVDDPRRGCRVRTLVDHGLGRLLVEALRFDAGAVLPVAASRQVQALLVVDGEVAVQYPAGDSPASRETLGEWDFIYLSARGAPGLLHVGPQSTLLALTLRN